MPPHAADRALNDGGPRLSDEAGLDAGDPHACLHAISEGRDLAPAAAAALFEQMMDGDVPPVLTGAEIAPSQRSTPTSSTVTS